MLLRPLSFKPLHKEHYLIAGGPVPLHAVGAVDQLRRGNNQPCHEAIHIQAGTLRTPSHAGAFSDYYLLSIVGEAGQSM